MALRELEGRRALVTGASSGIGQAIALQLLEAGTHVLVTARREENLRAVLERVVRRPAQRAFAAAGDITRGEFRKQLIECCSRELEGLDILVNAAGVGAFGDFAQANPARLREIMEVNFFAPLELIRLAIPVLRVGAQPLIVNVGSVLGHVAVPGKSEYCASKFALHGFNDSLRAELQRENIDVLLVSPSTTDSEFFDKLLEGSAAQARRSAGMPPEVVARATLRAMRSNRREIILSAGGKSLVWLDRLCPALGAWLLSRQG